MRTHFNDLKVIADAINNLDFLTYIIQVKSRNGYYVVEAYDKRDITKLTYVLRAGMTCKECQHYLMGIRHAGFYMKPF